MAKIFSRRMLVLLALVVLSVVLGKLHVPHGNGFGFWDGPVGG